MSDEVEISDPENDSFNFERVARPLCANSGTHLYPEITTLITAVEATGVQLKPETYIKWSIPLAPNI